MTETGRKACFECKREFEWRDFGSSEKFEKSRLCPDCDHANTPTPDTKQGEGLGEATVSCSQCALFGHSAVCGKEHDALTQRVKVLEEAAESPHSRAHREKALEFANKERVRYRVALLQIAGMENLMFAECDDAEEIVRMAKEALDLKCGNCGDDGEEPSSNCPTCHGTGFKALAPPVGEKEK